MHLTPLAAPVLWTHAHGRAGFALTGRGLVAVYGPGAFEVEALIASIRLALIAGLCGLAAVLLPIASGPLLALAGLSTLACLGRWTQVLGGVRPCPVTVWFVADRVEFAGRRRPLSTASVRLRWCGGQARLALRWSDGRELPLAQGPLEALARLAAEITSRAPSTTLPRPSPPPPGAAP